MRRTPLASMRIANTLRRQILSGELAAGELLPPERALASLFFVNRLTLRHALSELSGQGLIESRQGDGTRVRDFRRHGSFDLLTSLFAIADDNDARTLLADVLEMRRALAVQAVELACERRTPADLEAFDIALARLGEAVATHQPRVEIVRAEERVTLAVIAAAHNLALTLMVAGIRRFISEHPAIELESPLSPKAIVASYRALGGHLRKRDKKRAASLTDEQYKVIARALLKKSSALRGRGARRAKRAA